jgi:hypothetical protein
VALNQLRGVEPQLFKFKGFLYTNNLKLNNMKLIENTTFGFECKSKEKNFKTRLEYLDWYEKSRNNYDLFLEQPLKLEMFVGDNAIFYFQFEFKEWGESDMENQTIEDLLNDDLSYVLKENAIKRIFG